MRLVPVGAPRATARARKPSSFAAWVDDFGVERLAKKLNVSPKTVKVWQSGLFYPRVEQMRRIKKFTRGFISYDLMIDCTTDKKRRR